MKLGESKIVVEFSLEERDDLVDWIRHELTDNNIPHKVYDILKELGALLAPGWC